MLILKLNRECLEINSHTPAYRPPLSRGELMPLLRGVARVLSGRGVWLFVCSFRSIRIIFRSFGLT